MALASRPCRLSPAQRWILFLGRRETAGAFDLTAIVPLPADDRRPAVENTVVRLFERHPMLASEVVRAHGQFYQQPRRQPVKVVWGDLNGTPPEDRYPVLERWMHDQPDLALSPAGGAVTCVGVVALDPATVALVFKVAHVAADRRSLAILIRDVKVLHSVPTGAEPPLPELTEEFASHADTLAEFSSSPRGLAVQERLATTLNGATALRLPTDHPRGRGRGPNCRVVRSLGRADAQRVATAARAARATPFVMLLAAAARTFGSWSGQGDFILQTALANRPRRSLDDVVGCFAGPAFLRLSPGAASSSDALLGQVRRRCFAMLQDAAIDPFDLLGRCPQLSSLSLDRDHGSALFQWLPRLDVVDRASTMGAAPGLEKPWKASSASRPVMADLHWVVEERADGLTIVIEYDGGLFDPGTIEYWAGRFVDTIGDDGDHQWRFRAVARRGGLTPGDGHARRNDTRGAP